MKKQTIEKICLKLKDPLIEFKFLAAGSHNECYVVTCEKKKYIFKTGNKPEKLKSEFKILKKVNGLGPRVYIFDQTAGPVLVEEFLDGKHPGKKPTDQFIREMALWYKRLHSIKTSKLPREERKIIYSLYEWVSRKYQRCAVNIKDIEGLNVDKIESFFSESFRLATKYDKIFSKRKVFSLTQNDPSLDNIFITDGKIKLIDWEFSGFGLYERDLLNFLDRFKLNEQEKRLFFKTYGLSNSENTRIRLDMLQLILIGSDIGYLINRIGEVKKGNINGRLQSSNIDKLRLKLTKKLIIGKRLLKNIK